MRAAKAIERTREVQRAVEEVTYIEFGDMREKRTIPKNEFVSVLWCESLKQSFFALGISRFFYNVHKIFIF